MTVNWLERAVAQTHALHPYVPGKPVEQLLREKGIAEAVKLASNENPYGAPPKALQAVVHAAVEIHRYPDGNSTALKAKLAAKHAVSENTLVLGNGSNEVLELLIRTFAGAGDEVVFSRRAFIVYALAAQAAGATTVAVPEADGLTHDLQAMQAAVTEKTKVVCIANPNNPTGTLLSNTAIQAFLDTLPRDVLVIVDEAYYEFVADTLGDSLQCLSHPGLVVSRTFSKAYGLAGLRVGYAVMDAQIAALVNRFREPFNINSVAQEAALAALDDEAWVMQRVTQSNAQRQRLQNALADWGILGGESFANFVLLQHTKASVLASMLEDEGVIPRPLSGYAMGDYLRISVGSAEENDVLLRVLEKILPQLSIEDKHEPAA